MTVSGWVKLPREMADNPIWLSEPFTLGQAWADLLMHVAYRDYSSHGKKYRAGCVYMTVLQMAARWKWTRDKVRWALDRMEKEGLIRISKQRGRTGGTIVYVVGWNMEDKQHPFKSTVVPKKTEDEHPLSEPQHPFSHPFYDTVVPMESGNQHPFSHPHFKKGDDSTPVLKDTGAYRDTPDGDPSAPPPVDDSEMRALASAMMEDFFDDV